MPWIRAAKRTACSSTIRAEQALLQDGAPRQLHKLGQRCRWILESRRDLEPLVFSMLLERIPKLSREEILMIVGLPLQELLHSRAVQEFLEEGLEAGGHVPSSGVKPQARMP